MIGKEYELSSGDQPPGGEDGLLSKAPTPSFCLAQRFLKVFNQLREYIDDKSILSVKGSGDEEVAH